jgi:hypothetical protein
MPDDEHAQTGKAVCFVFIELNSGSRAVNSTWEPFVARSNKIHFVFLWNKICYLYSLHNGIELRGYFFFEFLT